MKNLISLFLIISNYFAAAQIAGTVLNENNTPVEFATILNLNEKTSAVTKKDGIFLLTGKVNDTIRIEHVSYITKEFEVKDVDDDYILFPKNLILEEVTVTTKHAINLFKKSCINTFNSFNDKSIYKGYFSYVSTIDMDTTQIIDIDFDIVQKKLKNIEKGEKINPYRIQERNEFKPNAPFCQTKPFFTYINQLYDWANFLGGSYSLKEEDSLQVKIYFIGKSQKVEVAIQRKDSCLVSVTVVSAAPFTNKEGVPIMNKKSVSKIEYAYENGVGYISEMSNLLVLPNPRDSSETLTFTQFFKTYNYEKENMKRRPKGHLIFGNSWDPQLIKNKYEEMFWKRNSENESATENMEKMVSFTVPGIEAYQADPSIKSNSTTIGVYRIGFYK